MKHKSTVPGQKDSALLDMNRRPQLTAIAVILTLCLAASVADKLQAQTADPALGTEERIGAGFRGRIYFLSEGTSALPKDFSLLKSEGDIYTETLNVAARSFDTGFPGVTNRFEWFAIEYTTTFQAARAGEYAFRIVSDDGTKLFIDDRLVIDNDGTHPPRAKEGSVQLSAGAHSMVVQYFQGPRNQIALQLFYARGNQEPVVFPGTDFTLATPGGSTWYWWLAALACLLALFMIFFLVRRRRNENQEN